MKLTRTLALATQASIILTVTGCGWLTGEDGLIRDSREDYRQAQVAEPLALPEGADTQAIRELYYIPGAGQTLVFQGDKFKVPRPDMQTVSGAKELKAYKSGNEHWIVLDATPEEAWGRVRSFWEVNGIELEHEVPFRGLMETVWLKRNNEGYISRDKFRVIVEHGLQKGLSEVHIRHLGYDFDNNVIASQNLDWDSAKADDELALAMTQELSSYLLETENRAAPASLLAQKFVGKPKSSFKENAQGEWVIDMSLSYGRAWNAIGKAIDAAGFELEDRNRDAGLYHVLVTSGEAENESEGFFSFLSFGDDEETVTRKVTIQVKRITGTPQKVRALISNHDDSLDASMRKEVMSRIKNQLI